MRTSLLALVVLLAVRALAVVDVSSIVKTSSGLCGDSDHLFHGSGLAFTDSGKSFVLTSEHVLLHGNDRYCHWVWNARLGKISARLRAVEYGNGLALLELEKPIDALPSLSGLSPRDGLEGESIDVIGFAFSQEELISKNSGRVLVAQSTRALIPMVPKMTETIDAHGEYGMSGGPVFSDKGEFVGVLSHQYVRLIPGQKAKVSEFSKDSLSENHLLVIPAAIVLPWVRQAVSASAPLPSYLVRDPEMQLKGREVVVSSGLRFEFSDAFKGNPVGGADGAGRVGGADGAGAGGGDGATWETHSVRITLDTSESHTLWDLPWLAPWVSAVKERLRLPWNSIEVPFFLARSGEAIEAVRIKSLPDFFQKLARPDLEPVTLVRSNLAGTSTGSSFKEAADVQELKSIGTRLSEILGEMKKQSPPPEAVSFLERVGIVANLLSSNSWAYLKPKQIENLTDVRNHSAAWKPLFDKDFDLTVELLEKLNQVQKLISELKA